MQPFNFPVNVFHEHTLPALAMEMKGSSLGGMWKKAVFKRQGKGKITSWDLEGEVVEEL